MNRTLILFILGSLITFFACERNDEYLPERDVQVLRDSCSAEAKEYYKDNHILHFTDSSGYDELRSFCPDLPDINFNRYSVIGHFTTAQACSVKYSRQVLNHDVSGSISLVVDMQTYGDCRVNHDSWNLVRIPAADSSTNIMIRKFREDR